MSVMLRGVADRTAADVEHMSHADEITIRWDDSWLER